MVRAVHHEPLAFQISPDKSMNCHDTTAGFTVQSEFLAFVVMCQLDPAAQPYIRSIRHIPAALPSGQLKLFKIIPDDFVCSSTRRFALRLPSDNTSRHCLCLRLVVIIVNMISAELSDKGLALHKFMPILGVDIALQALAELYIWTPRFCNLFLFDVNDQYTQLLPYIRPVMGS